MSTFDYPVLSRADIISILAESQIAAVTDNDFKNIKPDFVSNLYTRLLIYLDALNEEDQGQFEFSALEQIENPDLLIGSFHVMNLYCTLTEVMESLKCPLQFNLRDLFKPDPRRTEHFLSAILNFCLYKETKMNLLRPIVEELALLDDQRKEQETKIYQLNAEIAGYNEARERELPLVQEVESKVKELREMIAGFNSMADKCSILCGELTYPEDLLSFMVRPPFDPNVDFPFRNNSFEISQAEFDLVQSVQENVCKALLLLILKPSICANHSIPNGILRALEEKKLTRDEAKNAERSAMQSFQQKNATVEVYSKNAMHHEKIHLSVLCRMHIHLSVLCGSSTIAYLTFCARSVMLLFVSPSLKCSVAHKKMSKHFALMQAMHEQVNSAKSVEKECKSMKAKLSNDAVFDKSLEAKLIEQEGKGSMKSEVLSERHELEARQKKVEDVVKEVDFITLKTDMVRESGAAKVRQLISKCEELVKQFQVYSSSIGLLLPEKENGTKKLDSVAITSL
ncbi:Kinetochore protein nuf2 isoform 3 [Hibiscus syriacus]|uniref:Kinetochore protein nuf2 isoform 3 n=1 Tax=Hibiscus syriacus TaxID=106335 RepID=A0A6A2XGX9_HIBSY|nr:Kinetochore protein nuf2 isoform 3 [Hibiscus syriacus]